MSKPLLVAGSRAAYPIIPKDLPSEDGENMESPWHRNQMQILIHVLEFHWRDRKDFYCGGNMFIHFSEKRLRNEDFRGPDFFVVLGAEHDRPRDYWAIWEEDGKYPDLIIELLSPTTATEDLTTKKAIYEQTFRTPEYFCLDPDGFSLKGWRLSGHYRTIKTGKDRRMWSETLQLFLGTWHGNFDGLTADYLRFFDAEGQMLPTPGEAATARADAEAERADAEAKRADAAEEELERLRNELAAIKSQQGRNGKS